MSKQESLKRRGNYSPIKLNLALSRVRFDAMSKRTATITYGIPRTTLLDKLAGLVPEVKSRPGPTHVLTAAEKVILVRYINIMTKHGTHFQGLR